MVFVTEMLFKPCKATAIEWSINALLDNEQPKKQVQKKGVFQKQMFYPEQNTHKKNFSCKIKLLIKLRVISPEPDLLFINVRNAEIVKCPECECTVYIEDNKSSRIGLSHTFFYVMLKCSSCDWLNSFYSSKECNNKDTKTHGGKKMCE